MFVHPARPQASGLAGWMAQRGGRTKIKVYKCTNVQTYERTNVRMYALMNARMCTNKQTKVQTYAPKYALVSVMD